MHRCNETLLRLAKDGDEEALEAWIWDLMPYIKALSRRFLWQEDALQAGLMILPEVLKRFDPERGTEFFAYAMPWVLGEMKKAGERSRHWRRTQVICRMRREQERIQRECMRSATPDELSRAAGIDRAELMLLLENSHDMMPDWEESVQDPESDKWLDQLLLKDMLRRLEPDEQRLLHLRFVEGKKQKEAAEILHTSQSGISRMENKVTNALLRMWTD